MKILNVPQEFCYKWTSLYINYHTPPTALHIKILPSFPFSLKYVLSLKSFDLYDIFTKNYFFSLKSSWILVATFVISINSWIQTDSEEKKSNHPQFRRINVVHRKKQHVLVYHLTTTVYSSILINRREIEFTLSSSYLKTITHVNYWKQWLHISVWFAIKLSLVYMNC